MGAAYAPNLSSMRISQQACVCLVLRSIPNVQCAPASFTPYLMMRNISTTIHVRDVWMATTLRENNACSAILPSAGVPTVRMTPPNALSVRNLPIGFFFKILAFVWLDSILMIPYLLTYRNANLVSMRIKIASNANFLIPPSLVLCVLGENCP